MVDKPEPDPRSIELVASLDDFTRSYLVTALWSSNDESDESGGVPLDDNYELDDLHPDVIAEAIADCQAFLAKCGTALCDGVLVRKPSSGSGPEEVAGHDFWLTRNGHGAGFWDGDWAGPLGDMLTKIAKGFGEVSLYVGDDGRIYSM
ncbi:MAG: hypothetical protein J0I99_00625 [Devosia sp.]|mgnify:CR=1 FL=1|uniref:hypothetical protein n=1 Tax=Devosia sp. TaxID=1871048 RepID=UPI001AC2D1FE|nr:hypothetical protein [Devosia sp.]MBN9314221.1 hypothetical protein [Devosia sp.]